MLAASPDTSHHPSLHTRRDWARVDLAAVQAYGADAAVLLARISYRTSGDRGPWQATMADLAADTGLRPSAVRSALGRLRDAGVVAGERADRWCPTLSWRVVLAGHQENAESVITRTGESGSLENAESEFSSLHEEPEELPEPPVTPPVAPAAVYDGETLPILTVVPDPSPEPSALDAEFDAFWEHYPRHVGKAKARQSWVRARRTTPLEVIARGLMAQLPDLQSRETPYVPHPATWLNQQRWADDAQHAVTRPVRGGNVFADPGVVARAEQMLASWETPAALGGVR